MLKNSLTLAVLAAVGLVGTAQARDQIRIVGSSTVYPFSTVVAEQFGKTSSFKTPIVESTGSGGGLKLFCGGVGERHPDIANASRRIKKSEADLCAKNGVTDVVEAKIGFDGIVMANSKTAPTYRLTLRDVYLGLAKNVPTNAGGTVPNPYTTWNQVNPGLPATRIEVLGPPPTSGTRDAFVELAMEGGCKTFAWVKDLKGKDKAAYKALCHTIREDGAFIEAGENDNLIVHKLAANPDALGIFGFSFLDQNIDKVQGSPINGHAPTFENIARGAYSISRPLFFYVKKAHVGRIPGIREFVAEFTDDKAWGEDGYLSDKGLIPLPKEERALWQKKVRALVNLVM
jgi:phosphate transport system substrate-binding protein